MAESPVIFALRRKYAQLRGMEAHYATEDREAVSVALGHVGATLLMFNPAEDLAAVRPRRPYNFRGGLWTRLAITILQVEGRPMSARALARRIIGVRGLDHQDRATLKSIECALHKTLTRLEGHGLDRVCERPKRWATPQSR